MNLKNKESKQALVFTGFLLTLFSGLIILGLLYRPVFFDTGGEAGASLSTTQSSHDLGVNRIQRITEGDLNEFSLQQNGEAFCRLNIEGRPEDYSTEWDRFFLKLQEKKNITIKGWKFQRANSSNSESQKDLILGVSMQYSPN